MVKIVPTGTIREYVTDRTVEPRSAGKTQSASPVPAPPPARRGEPGFARVLADDLPARIRCIIDVAGVQN